MMIDRPDLSTVPTEVKAYIEALETELLALRAVPFAKKEAAPPEPSEPPTTQNVITISKSGLAKRTPRHFYTIQRRGGMGVFGFDVAEDDPPALLAVADESDTLLLLTNFGRAFRLAVRTIAEQPVNGKGVSIESLIKLRPSEVVVALLRADAGQYLLLGSKRGWVRRIPAVRIGKSLIQGMTFHNVQEGGYLTAAGWSPNGEHQVMIVTRLGRGIRFAEQQVPSRGCLGLRVAQDDGVVGITAVLPTGMVCMVRDDGKGTVRHMNGFMANKAPGAGGKVAMKTDALISITAVSPNDHLFIISALGKIIRFLISDIPFKEGVVQGVNCMALRNDAATAFAIATPQPEQASA